MKYDVMFNQCFAVGDSSLYLMNRQLGKEFIILIGTFFVTRELLIGK